MHAGWPGIERKAFVMDGLQKILLVEENPLLRSWVRENLLREGFWVVAPSNAQEAIRVAGVFAFDAVISNWRLSGEHDGAEVLRAAQSQNPDVVAILISGSEDGELSGLAHSAGFHQVVRKPFPLTDLLCALKTPDVRPTEAATR